MSTSFDDHKYFLFHEKPVSIGEAIERVERVLSEVMDESYFNIIGDADDKIPFEEANKIFMEKQHRVPIKGDFITNHLSECILYAIGFDTKEHELKLYI